MYTNMYHVYIYKSFYDLREYNDMITIVIIKAWVHIMQLESLQSIPSIPSQTKHVYYVYYLLVFVYYFTLFFVISFKEVQLHIQKL